MQGYIYKISNDLNSKVYIGQTVRDIQVRFNEHCFDSRATSQIHKAIKDLGYMHFKCELLESCNSEDLDAREAYWVNYYDSYNNGYNSTPHGQYSDLPLKPNYDHIIIYGPNLVFESRTSCARFLKPYLGITESTIADKLNQSINDQKLFLNKYKVAYIDTTECSSIDDLENWAKYLQVTYTCKKIHLIELDKDFDSITSAAVWLLENKYFTGYSRTPLQSLITSISGALKDQNRIITACDFHFEELPEKSKNKNSDKQPFEATPIFCDQLNTEFPSAKVAADYFVQKGLWGKIKPKTAKCRISDIIRGYFREYKGYTFKIKNENGVWESPKLIQIQLPFLDKSVPVDWTASDTEQEQAQQFVTEWQVLHQHKKLKVRQCRHGNWSTHKELADLYLQYNCVNEVTRLTGASKNTIEKACVEYNIKIDRNLSPAYACKFIADTGMEYQFVSRQEASKVLFNRSQQERGHINTYIKNHTHVTTLKGKGYFYNLGNN